MPLPSKLNTIGRLSLTLESSHIAFRKSLFQKRGSFDVVRIRSGQHLEQDSQLQVEQLKAAGCEKVFTEKASGAKTDRDALRKAIARLEEGDTLWSRARTGWPGQRAICSTS